MIQLNPTRVGEKTLHIRQAVWSNLRKEVRHVTLTFHIGDYTIVIRVWKRKNRHSAK